MRTNLLSAPVPSPAVLRFLKIQTESLRFFSAATSSTSSSSSPCSAQQARISRSRKTSLQDDGRWHSRAPSGSTVVAYSCRNRVLVEGCASKRTLHNSCFSSVSRSSGQSLSSDSASSRRNISSTAPNRYWFYKEKPAVKPLQPDDLPPLAGFLDDNASLGRVIKPTNELKLRCTEFDENGNVVLVNGEFKKSELISKVFAIGI